MFKIPNETGFARQAFGHTELGDARRTASLVFLVAGLAKHAAGRITEVFATSSARERAYGLLESTSLNVLALLHALGLAMKRLSKKLDCLFIVLDGSSLHLADPHGKKGFGRVGSNAKNARGLKVITAYALNRAGIPLGIAWQEYWARLKRKPRLKGSSDRRSRPTHEKETQHWLNAIIAVTRWILPGKLWFLVDREGDSRPMLQTLMGLGVRFTVRSSWNRLLAQLHGKRRYLRSVMKHEALRNTYQVNVPAGPHRKQRTAKMQVRAKRVSFEMHNRWTHTKSIITLNVVWVHEIGTTPHGEEALDWMLLTNTPIDSVEDLSSVIRSYTLRWRIEDFHKTWKSGHCNVEDTQLRSFRAATSSAVMSATVAATVERLKHLPRTEPESLANMELSHDERAALVALVSDLLNAELAPGGRRQHSLKLPNVDMMSIGEAVAGLAKLGGYTGRA